MIIRKAEPADAQQIIEYVQNLAAEPGVLIAISPGEFNHTVQEEMEFIQNFNLADNSLFLVAEEAGEIVGILTCRGGHRLATRHSTMLGMSVAKGWRNQGIGSQLMAYAISWAKQSEIVKRIELAVFSSNEPAIHLYQKFGFVVEGRQQKAIFRDSQYHDDLIMALLL